MNQYRLRHFLRISGFCLFCLLVAVPVSVSAASRFIFAVNFIAGSVSTYRVDADTGMMYHIRFTPTLESPSSLVLRPDGKFLYVASQVLDQIAIYRVDERTGSLTEIKSSPVAAGVRSNFRLAMSPDGKLLYVPGRFTTNLMVFRSDRETGELTPLENNNFPTHGDRARYVAVSPDGRFVYVTNTNSNSVAAFKVDGENIQAVDGMPFEATDAPQAVTVHPNGKFLYVPNWQAEKITGYTINQDTGALAPIRDFKAETGVFPFNVTIHPSRKYLYVANWLSYDISGFHLDENTGRVQPMDGMPIAADGDAPVEVMFDDEGRFAYVPTYHDSGLTIFKVDDESGRLVDPRRVMTRPAVRRLAILKGEPVRFEPRWMVVADTDVTANKTNIRSYRVDAKTGELAPGHAEILQGFSSAIALQQEAGLVYAGQGKTLSAFNLSEAGQLKKLANVSVVTDGDVQALYVDQRGRHLYVATSKPAQYLAYEINAEDGGLKEVERVELPEDARPIQITSSPEQRLNFVLDSAKNRIFVFRFLSSDGPNYHQLSSHGSPFDMGEGLSDMVVDASGRFGLVVQAGEGTVAVYAMPTIWGPLKPVGKPLAVGKHPVKIAMHPDGEHFYVLDADARHIQQIRLDTVSGELTLAGEAVPLQGAPQALSIDPSGRFAYLSYSSRAGVSRFEIDAASGRLTFQKDHLDGVVPSALSMSAVIQ